jgi:hypothetical protein
MNEVVTVAGGNSTLTLNDGGTATYTGGSGTSAGSGADLANSKQTGGTLSSADNAQHANIGLLGNYMASSFAGASYNHGGSMVVAEASELGRQWMLSSPSACMQHA